MTTFPRSDSTENLATLTVAKDLQEGQKLCLTKFLAYGWSAHRSLPALRGQVGAALAEARNTGWKGLLAEQREYLDDFWARADVEIEGDAELQQSVPPYKDWNDVARARSRARA